MRYDPKKVEKKWQGIWLKKKVYEPDFARAKKPATGEARHGRPFYNLMMFPYPSAEGLHIGSVRTFTGVDIYGRFKRMQGHDVFEPIGLDGFGIHSENYALKVGKHPFEHAQESEKNFYRQLGMIGNSFAWNERVETYDPEYYKWTQWIFLQMFKHGLAYRKKALVNWCPSCKTVLADEQVVSGECERCGTAVIKKDLEQWFFKITDYTERLLNNLEKIDWPEPIKIAQRNWIGRSEGALIKFHITNHKSQTNSKSQISKHKAEIEVFTTRPDTLFGATYIVLGPEHPLLRNKELGIRNYEKISEYIKRARVKTDGERIAERKDPSTGSGRGKTGVELKGVKAINPANNEELPIFVADYVLGNVGTGAIMAVPAHDERDFEFAKKFELSIRDVVMPETPDLGNPPRAGKQNTSRKVILGIVQNPKTGKYLVLRWKKQPWITFVTGGIEEGEDPVIAAKREIREETGYKNIKLVRVLGGPTKTEFFATHKDVNRTVHVISILFELESKEQDEIASEERDAYDVDWLSPEELSKTEMRHGEFELIWKRVKTGMDAYMGKGVLINSGKFDGTSSEQAKWEITKFVGGIRKVQYRLRDWLISRQRYWGPPIPIIYCRNCWEKAHGSTRFAIALARRAGSPYTLSLSKGKKQKELQYGIDYATFDGENFMIHPVLEKDLPVKLPNIRDFRPTGTDKSPLATSEKFYKVKCPKCKASAYRETDVSDTFLDSAWYYLGYLMASQKWKKGFSDASFKRLIKKWLPVNMYIGGAEHAVLHLLYVRFVAMALRDWKYVGFEEPVRTFRTHGLITKDGAKMSKSKGNVVSPDKYISVYGSDAVRMYLAFLAPLTQGGDFRDEGIRGITRFLERTWKFFEATNHKSLVTNGSTRFAIALARRASSPSTLSLSKGTSETIKRLVHKTIKKVTEDIESFQYNTAISALMVLLNEFEKALESVTKKDFEIFLKLLAPFAPHISEELYQSIESKSKEIGDKRFASIHLQQWPKYSSRSIAEETFDLVIQVNGKVRGHAKLAMGAGEEEAKKAALAIASIKEYVSGEPRKVIFIPNKLINLVV